LTDDFAGVDIAGLDNGGPDIDERIWAIDCDQLKTVVLNLFHCWDPLNTTYVVWDPQVKIEKVCAPE